MWARQVRFQVQQRDHEPRKSIVNAKALLKAQGWPSDFSVAIAAISYQLAPQWGEHSEVYLQ